MLLGMVIPGWFLEPLRDVLHGAGYQVAYAVLREPLSVCAVRAQERERVIDLEGRTPDQAADVIAESLAAGGLTV
jgi:hypothetical protein